MEEEQIIGYLSTFNTPFASFDILVAVGVVALAILYVYTLGKDYATNLLAGVYIGSLTFFLVPGLKTASFAFISAPAILQTIGLYLISVIVAVFVVNRNGFFEPHTIPEGWENALFGILSALLVLFVLFQLLPNDVIAGLSPILQTLFVTTPYAYIWPLLPIVSLLIIKGDG
jgi:hypothetical protein